MAELKAKQITASGLVSGVRSHFRQLLVFSPVANDSIIKFYDRTTPPGVDDPHYHFDTYGKGVFNFPIVGDGVLFDDGIYVEVPTGLIVTVLYEVA